MSDYTRSRLPYLAIALLILAAIVLAVLVSR